MNLIHSINRPEYIFQPTQLFKRILLNLSHVDDRELEIVLPWGTKLKVNLQSQNKVSHSLVLQGVYDLSLTEVITRLLMSGETALDIGANIGYVTSLMASRVGKTGKVICFEPNPDVYNELCKIIENQAWKYVISSQLALSNKFGSGFLVVKSSNTGEGYLSTESAFNEVGITTYKVHQSRLDELDFLTDFSCIHLIKIDVEGHEREVLEGAGEWLSKKKIRDIIFEEHKAYPNETTHFLESFGYKIFRIRKGFWKPILIDPKQQWNHPWEPPNYLATVEPDRAMKLLSGNGWQSLRKKRKFFG